jgi:hypothetical protein
MGGGVLVGIIVSIATFNNISVISWRSVLMWEEIRNQEYLEKTTDLPQVTDKIYHLWFDTIHETHEYS